MKNNKDVSQVFLVMRSVSPPEKLRESVLSGVSRLRNQLFARKQFQQAVVTTACVVVGLVFVISKGNLDKTVSYYSPTYSEIAGNYEWLAMTGGKK